MKLNLLFAFSVVLFSCAKSFEANEANEADAPIFTASIDNGGETKTSLSYPNINWVINDQIKINGAIYKAETGGTISTTFAYVSGTKPTTPTYNAYYPASIYDASTGVLTLPSSYDYVENTFSYNPMYATSESKSLSFKNICAILAITIGTDSGISNVKTIEVSSSNKALSGVATIDGNNNAVLSQPGVVPNTVTLNCGSGVSVSSSKTFYIPVPAQTYRDLMIVVNDEKAMVTKKLTNIVISRSNIYSITFQDNINHTITPFSSEFTINSSGNKVNFSRGNLIAFTSSGSVTEDNADWKFSVNQYDYLGSNNVSGSSLNSSIDLFCWSTDGTNNATSNYRRWGINISTPIAAYYGNFVEWGINPQLVRSLGLGWRTLSSAEWKYLLDTRTCTTTGVSAGTNVRYANVIVNGVNGLLIFPDTFSWTSAMGTAPTTVNQCHSRWNDISYTTTEFSAIEQAGCIFLPAAGYRKGSNVDKVSAGGYYWSSTLYISDKEYAYLLNFNSAFANVVNYRRFNGYIVRLVQDVN